MEIFLGTKNKKKLMELQLLLKDSPFVLRTVDDFPNMPEPEEDKDSFRGNAEKKALYYAQKTGIYAVSDDSGLEVDALDGEPGVFSSRFAGEDATDEDNIEKLLQALEGVPMEKRTGRFRCVIALASPEKACFTVEGECRGILLEEKKGEGGFGYDPLFFYPALKKTFAQLSKEEKSEVSHRGKALRKLKIKMDNFFKENELKNDTQVKTE